MLDLFKRPCFILNLVKVSGLSQTMKLVKIHVQSCTKNKVFDFISCHGKKDGYIQTVFNCFPLRCIDLV